MFNMFNLSKESPLPLHIQLLNELRRAVMAGDLRPHSRVDSEPKLADVLGVSRTTIRQAWRAAEEEGRLMQEMWKEGVVGFLLWPAHGEGKGEDRFLEHEHVPAVFMDRPIPGLSYPCVAAEHYQGGVQAVQHLIDLGHRKIAYVT